LTDYVAILARRKWIVAVPLVLAPIMAVFLSTTQSPLYEASSSVLINRENIVQLVANQPDLTFGQDPERLLETQTNVARTPELIDRVVRAAGIPGITPGGLLAHSSVSARSNADVLDFSVTNRSPDKAARLATVYATEYTKYRLEKDTAALNDAMDRIRVRIQELRARGVDPASPLFEPLVTLRSQIETARTLQTSNTSVLRGASGANQIRPRTRRNGILGALLGGILGIGLAFLAEALDKRVRSERDIEAALGLPLLARLPRPARRLRKANELVMLAEPRSIAAEPLRTLRTNIEFANLERNARTMMVTSAVQREGKTTTIANLAIAMTRAGRRVVLVDLDLRRPYLHRFLRIRSLPGITDVVLGRLKLEEALRTVRVPQRGMGRTARGAPVELLAPAASSNGHGEVDGILRVLPAGTIPPDAGELVASEALGEILDSLREQFDFVLIDAPPLLVVGDAMTLSAKVDAMFVVTRLKVVHRGMLHEMARLLEACPAEKFGYVVASAELGEGYGYAYGYSYAATEAERSEQQHVS
jgi:Mrp family chromosome partitioning ATPase